MGIHEIAQSIERPRWRVLVAAGALAGAFAIPWPHVATDAGSAHVPARFEPGQATYRVVPISGDPLQDAADRDPGRCLDFLDRLVEHPHWQLQVADAWWTCTTSGCSRVMTISDDGHVAWDAFGMPTRALSLSSDELVTIASLDRLSCAAQDLPTGDRGTLVVAYGADPTVRAGRMRSLDDTRGGVEVPSDSAVGAAIGKVLDAATARYVEHRLEGLDVRMVLVARAFDFESWSRARARYRVELGPGRRLRIWRGTRLLRSGKISPAELVDLADWAEALPRGPAALAPYDIVRGSIRIGQRTIPIAIAASYPLVPLPRMIDDAIYDDASDRH